MKTYGNWVYHPNGRAWKHSYDPAMIVEIMPIPKHGSDRYRGKYRVLHTHPKRGGGVIMQPFDYANDMIKAKKFAVSHLKNWNDPTRWFKHH